ncbi:unnamed protein product [Caenorhabditis sp. 36 PRJEB53466]|nr:unnamed protein product [Caenorhabditis sp. 36 PRJEB53466]
MWEFVLLKEPEDYRRVKRNTFFASVTPQQPQNQPLPPAPSPSPTPSNNQYYPPREQILQVPPPPQRAPPPPPPLPHSQQQPVQAFTPNIPKPYIAPLAAAPPQQYPQLQQPRLQQLRLQQPSIDHNAPPPFQRHLMERPTIHASSFSTNSFQTSSSTKSGSNWNLNQHQNDIGRPERNYASGASPINYWTEDITHVSASEKIAENPYATKSNYEGKEQKKSSKSRKKNRKKEKIAKMCKMCQDESSEESSEEREMACEICERSSKKRKKTGGYTQSPDKSDDSDEHKDDDDDSDDSKEDSEEKLSSPPTIGDYAERAKQNKLMRIPVYRGKSVMSIMKEMEKRAKNTTRVDSAENDESDEKSEYSSNIREGGEKSTKYSNKPNVKYSYPPKDTLPLQTCFHNPSGYVCCNLELNNVVESTYKEIRESPNFNACNLQIIANKVQRASEKMFGHPFESVVAHADFAQNINFAGDLVCKLEIDGKYIMAYGTPYHADSAQGPQGPDGEPLPVRFRSRKKF